LSRPYRTNRRLAILITIQFFVGGRESGVGVGIDGSPVVALNRPVGRIVQAYSAGGSAPVRDVISP
jgi:hypothetical protein